MLIVAVRGRAGSSMAACWWVRPTERSGGRDVSEGSCRPNVGSRLSRLERRPVRTTCTVLQKHRGEPATGHTGQSSRRIIQSYKRTSDKTELTHAGGASVPRRTCSHPTWARTTTPRPRSANPFVTCGRVKPVPTEVPFFGPFGTDRRVGDRCSLGFLFIMTEFSEERARRGALISAYMSYM